MNLQQFLEYLDNSQDWECISGNDDSILYFWYLDQTKSIQIIYTYLEDRKNHSIIVYVYDLDDVNTKQHRQFLVDVNDSMHKETLIDVMEYCRELFRNHK